jgi:uncharacterized protein (DUF488 family)
MRRVKALYTIGHSNHPLETFLDLLALHRVALIADVRSVPYSKRHPHFCREALVAALGGRGIGYRHFPSLGGKYKVTVQWGEGLDQLLEAASAGVVAAMCAEADPMNCHRRLIADAASARGVDVIHLLPGGGFRHHEYYPSLFDGRE